MREKLLLQQARELGSELDDPRPKKTRKRSRCSTLPRRSSTRLAQKVPPEVDPVVTEDISRVSSDKKEIV